MQMKNYNFLLWGIMKSEALKVFPLQEAAASLLTKFTPPILTHPIQPADSAQTNKADLLCVFAARAA